MSKLLIKNGNILTVNKAREIIHNGAILIDENTISEVGYSKDLEEKYPYVEKFDAQGMVILPGFINAHVHAAQILLRGGPSQDKNHLDWLANVLYPAINNYDDEAVIKAYQLFSVEAVRSGITTIVDNIVWGDRKSLTEVALDTLEDIGLRTFFARIYSDLSNPDQDFILGIIRGKDTKINRNRFPIGKIEDTLTSIENLMSRYNNKQNSLINVWPAPGIPIFVSPEGLKGALILAEKFDSMFTIHLAETKSTSSHAGMSVIEFLEFLNVLSPRLAAAHCVWADYHDLRLLKINDVKVINNVVSNMFLGSGIAPISRMIDLGITVGIGTDDANCNNSVNFLSDMKITALAQKVKELDASVITAEKIIEMATIDGARVIGKEDKLGSIETGKIADLILLDMDQPHLIPCFHIPSTIVYQANGSEVDSVMVNGKWLMKRKEILFLKSSVEDVLSAGQYSAIRILKKSGMEHLSNRGWIT